MNRVLVIGGGPAGMAAAYSAAKAGGQVNIVDRNDEMGKKLLLTGNGKCNYSNRALSYEAYNFDANHPFAKIIEEYDSYWLEQFFAEVGMLTYQKDNYLYPKSEKALSVRDLFMKLLKDESVNIFYGKKALSIKFDKEYIVTFDDNSEIRADRIVIATGGKAYPATGSDGGGFKLARGLGHKVEFTYPVLTRLITKDKKIANMAGVRNKARVSALLNGEIVGTEEGEVQFTKEGLSGICIFNLSRYLSKPLEGEDKCQVLIDFVPEKSKEEIVNKMESFGSIEDYLKINFGEKTARFIMDKTKDGDYIATAKGLVVDISAHDDFSNAQVTKGGVNIEEVNGNLESTKAKGVYFAGEVLDVDGKCGGYNLHWAFVSGYLAGMNAALN